MLPVCVGAFWPGKGDRGRSDRSCQARRHASFRPLATQAGLRKVKLRGLAHVEWLFVFDCAAFNLKRIANLRAGVTA